MVAQDIFRGIRRLKDALKTPVSATRAHFFFRAQSPDTIIISILTSIQITPTPNLAVAPATEPQDCVACFTAPDNPINTRCGHVYCTECFLSQVSSADEQTIPLLCHGAGDTCKRAFGLKELKDLVPFVYFQKLLAVALRTYIKTHPTEFSYCPTADCTSVYRVKQLREEGAKEGENVFFCTKCLLTSCMTCCTPTHEGTTCRENKAAADGVAELAAYMADNNTKRCPQCQTMIEKVEGCNHLVCPGCSTHICWVCEALFTSDDLCYQHLRREHGGYGLPFEGGPNPGGNHGGGDDEDNGLLVDGRILAAMMADWWEAALANELAG